MTSAEPSALDKSETFAFALGVDLDDPETAGALGRFDLVVVDGTDASDELVDQLHEDGAVVLGYISVGTIEEERPWSAAAEPFRLEFWAEWDEWYADVADPRFRALVVEEIAPPVLDLGVDGLFLDNVDMVSTHPEQTEGMEELVAALDELVDERNALLFAQNGDDVIDGFADHLDGWNREDLTSTGDPESADVRGGERRRHRVRPGHHRTALGPRAAGHHNRLRRRWRRRRRCHAIERSCRPVRSPTSPTSNLRTPPRVRLTCLRVSAARQVPRGR